jgi:hypothetical protein
MSVIFKYALPQIFNRVPPGPVLKVDFQDGASYAPGSFTRVT